MTELHSNTSSIKTRTIHLWLKKSPPLKSFFVTLLELYFLVLTVKKIKN